MYQKRPVIITHGRGSRVWDTEGREYVDCTTGIGVASLGHAHPAVIETLCTQARQLITCHELFYNEQRARLFERLNDITPPALNRFFLCNSGTEANEGAIKFARMATKRHEIIATMRGYHGKTLGSLSATWDKKYREPFEPLVPSFRFIPFDDVEAAKGSVTENTAAVIVEIVQGEGGVRPGSKEFFVELREACSRHCALLIVDEVQTGLGRTGKMFAFEHMGVIPDILTLAKSIAGGLPMGVIGFGEAVGPVMKLAHTTTFGGNPLACAVARAVLEALVNERLAERAARSGEYFLSALRAVASPLVREVRGIGLMLGIELKQKAAPYAQRLMEEGVLVLLAGSTVLRLLPPLMIDRPEIDFVVARIAKVLGQRGTSRD
ncbi:MAG: aspartate aminotransferase family protein [Acidimicrobiia bacterium]